MFLKKSALSNSAQLIGITHNQHLAGAGQKPHLLPRGQQAAGGIERCARQFRHIPAAQGNTNLTSPGLHGATLLNQHKQGMGNALLCALGCHFTQAVLNISKPLPDHADNVDRNLRGVHVQRHKVRF